MTLPLEGSDPWRQALEAAAREGALLLVGPGVADPLPPGVERRHVPPGTCIPLAEGARLANPARPVVVACGDGDVYGTGLGALLHAMRRNTGVTCLVADNGMSAPRSATVGPGEYPIRPADLARAAGGTYMAEVQSHEAALVGVTQQALYHPGFALVHIYDRGVEEAPGILHRDPDRAAFEQVVVGQAPLVTAVWTPEPDDWERILYEPDHDPGDDDDDGNGDDEGGDE